MINNDKIWIVIAVYNEESGLSKILPGLKQEFKNILVVNDGSTDKSLEIIQNNNVLAISTQVRHGKGFSIREAFKFLKNKDYEFAVLIDGDGQHKPEDAKRLIQETSTRSLDMLIGNRMKNSSNMPSKRRFLNRFYSWVLSKITGKDLPDVLCGYRVLSKELIQKIELKTNEFEIEGEILLEAIKNKAKIDFIDIPCVYADTKSHLKLFSDTLKIAKFTFPYAINKIRGRYT